MISLKVNDIVFLENVGVHARVEAVDVLLPEVPPMITRWDSYGNLIKCMGQAERPKVVVTLVQVEV